MLKDQIYGSLYGFAIGDAMGATTEFMTRDSIKSKYGRVESILGGGWLGLTPGKVTDDTQMMLCVADAVFNSNGTLNDTLRLCCSNFHRWLATKPIDVGNACNWVISSCKTNNPKEWFKVSEQIQKTQNEFLGNGGLMRCLVPAILGYRNLAVKQSKLTHNNRTCDFYASRYCSYIQDSLRNPERAPSDIGLRNPSGHVADTFTNCIHWASCTESFKDAILLAVNDGGDADTIAALTGGLVGIRYGVSAIPENWIRDLDFDICLRLESLADDILEAIGG